MRFIIRELDFGLSSIIRTRSDVNLKLNINSIYLPQKYETIIRNVTQSGEYMLRASSVDTKKEVLTFGAANAVITKGTGEVLFPGWAEHADLWRYDHQLRL